MERFDIDKEPVYHLFDVYKAGRINLSPSYQRGKVWSDDLRYTLIESIRSEFPIGLIMFNVSHHVDEEGVKIEVYDAVDGQQRLRTILSSSTVKRLGRNTKKMRSYHSENLRLPNKRGSESTRFLSQR